MRIGELARTNKWWKGEPVSWESLKPLFEHTFLSQRTLPPPGNYVMRGPRQVGKTEVLLRGVAHLFAESIPFQNITYISCDRLGGLGELRNTVRELRQVKMANPGPKVLLLDEITSVTGWEKGVKEFCEEGFFKVYATGSRPKELEARAELFPGRAEILNFYPLSFAEFCVSLVRSCEEEVRIEGKKGTLWTYSRPGRHVREFLERFGLAPESGLVGLLGKLEPGLEVNSVRENVLKLSPFADSLEALFRVYLETGGYPASIESRITGGPKPFELVVKDTLGTVEKEGLSIEVLNRLLPELLRRMGSRVEYAGLAREVEVDPATVMRYVETLERSFLLREIYRLDGRVQPRKAKKVYFSDPFIFRALCEYYNLEVGELGPLVEAVAVEHICRAIEDSFRHLWKTSLGYGEIRGREVDLVLGRPSLRIEVKYEEMPGRRDVDIVLTKDELNLSSKPWHIPVALFLLGCSETAPI
jgi:predicted AAA+ superfamily ATPase